MSNKLTNYVNQYNDEKIEILFEQNQDDYAIDLIENQKSFFMFLYNLSQIELTKFRRYFDDILLKNWIKHFIFLAKIFIFFIFKKNDNFRLCVDYRNLNAIIIKNRHSLSLIIKILNRLCNVVLFIKLNFIHVYHRIRIKKKNEWKTIFRTWYKHFEYQVIFFELINAFIIFQVYCYEFNHILNNLNIK